VQVIWTVFTNARSEKAARNIYRRLMQRMGREGVAVTIEPYWKTGGHMLIFATNLAGASWNDQVVEAIALGQRAGYSWMLLGDVSDDLSGWSNKASVSGIEAMEWNLGHPTHDDPEEAAGAEAVSDSAGDEP
jgi:hypothetical protein